MNRKIIIKGYFQKKEQLLVSNKNYAQHLLEFFDLMTNADDVTDDITGKTLSLKKYGKAAIFSKQDGVVTGIEEVCFLIGNRTNLKVKTNLLDGQKVKKGQIILQLEGTNHELLSYERFILNILGRMSGIATFVSRQVYALKKVANQPYVAATRKTPWMLLDKKAVAVGGGLTHRLNLSDFPLVKDNYLQALRKEQNITFEQAVKRAFLSFSSSFFEIEVRNTLEWQLLHKTLEHKLKEKNMIVAIMLDNFELKNASELIKEIKNHPLYDHILIEVSGEITEQNLLQWAKTGADIVSMGALTHSAPTFNVSMRMV